MSTPYYPTADYIINPSGIDDIITPNHYRIIEGNTVREATDNEKAIIDQNRLPDLKETKRDSVGEVLRAALRAANIDTLNDVMAVAATEYRQAVVAIEAATTVAELDAINVEI